MATLLAKALLLTLTTLLVVPPGWCCIFPAHHGEPVPAPKKSHCCTSETPSRKQTPAKEAPPPTRVCCCPTDSTLPTGPEKVVPDAAVSPLAFAPATLSTVAGPAAGTGAVSPDTGQPLHLLHCVWRC